MQASRRWTYGLLVLPFAGLLFPALYNRADPPLLGLPFFYWYQLCWVVVTVGLLCIVVAATREGSDAGD